MADRSGCGTSIPMRGTSAATAPRASPCWRQQRHRQRALCLDNDDVLGEAGKFLTALVERYRDKPATLGYDVWNKGGVQECYCRATQAKFREWLKAKYRSLEALGRAWHRYSFGDWESVHPPPGTGDDPDSLDC